MKTFQVIISLLTIGLLTGCQTETISTESPVASSQFSKTIMTFNNGAALLEQYNYSEAEQAFTQVLETEPDWTAARFNLGLAHLNMYDQPGEVNYVELSREAFEKVLQSNPDHLHALFCLGLYLFYFILS